MTFARRNFGTKTIGKDSAAAIQRAVLFLTGARSLDHVTAESLARSCNLSLKRAEYELTIARGRRAE